MYLCVQLLPLGGYATPAQHAAVGANILEHYEIEAAQRQAVGRPAGTKELEANRPQVKQRAPQARDHAAATAGSTGRSVNLRQIRLRLLSGR